MNRLISFGRRTATLLGIVTVLSQSGTGNAQAVLTQHNDQGRSGSDTGETILNRGNVNVKSFGKLFSLSVDGYLFAQPLYDPNISIAGGTHNVLFVATAHDSVYAFDADSGTRYWQVSLGTPVPSSVINTPNIQVEVGIIGTPVIDPSSGTLYVVAKTFENNTQIFRLHALNLGNGSEKSGSPVVISASVPGNGQESSGGNVKFESSQENQRPALTLAGGNVYIAFASHEDHTPYHGWVLEYTSSLQQVHAYCTTPNGGEGAIWMGGDGLIVDSSNNLYMMTGNSSQSTENSSNDYGQSFLKLDSALGVVDYFKPKNYDSTNAGDTDLGSGGAVAIAGTTDIAGVSKAGVLYVVNTNNMGKLNTGGDQNVQEFQAGNGLWGSPAFFNNTMYFWGANEAIRAYQFSGGKFNTSASSKGSFSSPGGLTNGAVSISSDGSSSTAIVWATMPTGDPDHATVGGNVYAFDATNLATVLWDSTKNSSRDGLGNWAKFVPPTIANGKVYVATHSKQVAVYGLLGGGGGNLIANGTYGIKNVNSGLVLEDPNGSTVQAQAMDQSAGTHATWQQWVVTNLGNNVITLKNVSSGQFLDVAGASKTNGAIVDQWPANNQTNQQWQVVSVGGGAYQLDSVNSGLAAEVAGGSKANGAAIHQWAYSGDAWMQWIFQAP